MQTYQIKKCLALALIGFFFLNILWLTYSLWLVKPSEDLQTILNDEYLLLTNLYSQNYYNLTHIGCIILFPYLLATNYLSNREYGSLILREKSRFAFCKRNLIAAAVFTVLFVSLYILIGFINTLHFIDIKKVLMIVPVKVTVLNAVVAFFYFTRAYAVMNLFYNFFPKKISCFVTFLLFFTEARIANSIDESIWFPCRDTLMYDLFFNDCLSSRKTIIILIRQLSLTLCSFVIWLYGFEHKDIIVDKEK